MAIKYLVWSIALTAIVWQTSESWSAVTVGQLPEAVAQDILSILIYGTVNVVGNCSNANNITQVQYWLFTKQNPDTPIIINSVNQIDRSKSIIILIHGWGGSADINYIHAIKNQYVATKDVNVISVDYSEYAAPAYQTAYCYAPGVGRQVGQFLCNMSLALNINLGNVHVVGHSLGSHVAGFAGKYTQQNCSMLLGRITGLDPAGPLYQGIAAKDRLAKTDATLVDVIHTDQGEFGYIGSLGDVDFYPNCGIQQPGCPNISLSGITTLQNIPSVPVDDIDCNHQRSCYLFAESIFNNAFYSTSCDMYGSPIEPVMCPNDGMFATHAYMGESLTKAPPSKNYILSTNGQSLYAKGPTAA